MSLLGIVFLLSASPAPLELWPVPATIEVSNDRGFEVTNQTPVVVADDATPDERAALQVLFDAAGGKLPVMDATEARRGGAAIYVGEPGRNTALSDRRLKRAISDLEAPGPQGYRLAVSRSYVIVAGSDTAGTFYGLQILAQLILANHVLPTLQARDEPSLPMRGVVWQGQASGEQLRNLAALTCNVVLFASDDFCDLTNETGPAWKAVFDEARRYHMEPIPMLRLLDGAQALVRRHPTAAEGMTAVDHLVLNGRTQEALTKPNVVDVAGSPIIVRVSGRECQRDTDFSIEPGLSDLRVGMEPPPWTIRRLPGGAIPDGATVDVTYTYIPLDSASLCPAAPETAVALQECFTTLNKELKPRFVHIGMDTVQALNRDLRCAKAGTRDADAFAALVTLADKAAKKAEPATRVMMWADALNPYQGGVSGTLSKAAPKLPKNVILTVRDSVKDAPRHSIKSTMAWCKTVGKSYFAATSGDLVNAYTWVRELASDESKNAGIIYAGDADRDGQKALRLALGKAWSESSFRLAWPEGLNDYFDAALWEPKPEEATAALAGKLNREVLRGVTPEAEFSRFEKFIKEFRERLPEDDLDAGAAERTYRSMVEYLTLEAAYTEKQSDSHLRQLVKLVETQAKQDPNSDPDRMQEIVGRIKETGLFVPSTILFGPYLLPYRTTSLPSGHVALELPGAPEFHDTEHHAEATFDFIASPGPICRVDFETVGTTALTLERSDDAQTFTQVQKWKSDAHGGLRAPVLPSKPFRTRGLRISVDAANDQAILRNPRVFALKEPTAVVCAISPSTPVLDASFKEPAWPQVAQVDGFVSTEQAAFAEAQTTVRLVRTKDSLFIGIYAREPRMDTMSANLTQHDDPVWKEESCAILIDTGASEPFCFAVNPLGTQYESRGGNASWNGAWQAVAKAYTVGWAAEIAIPFATLGATPQKGTTWNMNFVRTRFNVKKEESTWTKRDDGTGDTAAFGKVTF